MKVFRRLSALTMVLALLLSMSLSVFAADFTNMSEGFAYEGEDTDVNITISEDVNNFFYEAKEGKNYNIGTNNGSALNGVGFGGSGDVVINTDVNGLHASEDVSVAVTGDVGNYVHAEGNAEVAVGGDVNGSLNVDGEAKAEVVGDVDGELDANDKAQVEVGGDVNGNVESQDYYYLDYETGEDVLVVNNSSVNVGGNVAGDVKADGNAAVTVKGNVDGNVHAFNTTQYDDVTDENILTDVNDSSVNVGGNVTGNVAAYGKAKITVEGNVDGDINASNDMQYDKNNEWHVLDVNNSSVNVGGNVAGSATADGNAKVTVEGNVDGSVNADNTAQFNENGEHIVLDVNNSSVSIGGNVNNGVSAEGNAEVSIAGDVSSKYSDTIEMETEKFIVGYSGVYAAENATVNVGGDVNGGDTIGDDAVTSAHAGDGIIAYDFATVNVGGNVNGGDAKIGSESANEDMPQMAGTGIEMANSATVTVGGNVAGGSFSGGAGTGGDGIVIFSDSEEGGGSLNVGGSVTGGSAPENGTNGVGFGIYAVENVPLPEMTVGSYDSIGGYIGDVDGFREMTNEELNAVKNEIETTSAGESVFADESLWNNVLGKIHKAKPGDEVTINLYGRRTIPAFVIEAVRKYDVKLIIKWNGGDDLVITKDFTAEVRGLVQLKDLAEMLKK